MATMRRIRSYMGMKNVILGIGGRWRVKGGERVRYGERACWRCLFDGCVSG